MAIAKELEDVKRAFYCELCDKQYKKISEYEQHLQSYDHHHKKRFKDMKETARNSTVNQSEREKKLAREKKREERELKRMQEAIQKRAGATGASNPIQKAAPIVNNSSISNNGGWSTTSATPISGGWSKNNTILSGGGQSNVATAPTTGGWSTTLISNTGGGWSSTPAVSNTGIQPKSSTISSPGLQANSPATLGTKEAPKKLTFGLKKSGFQFNLRKK
jgi:hypothetical protein